MATFDAIGVSIHDNAESRTIAKHNSKPVVVLALANDRSGGVGYLRNLPEEARRLHQVLDAAGQQELCEVVVRQHATADDILNVFQEAPPRHRATLTG